MKFVNVLMAMIGIAAATPVAQDDNKKKTSPPPLVKWGKMSYGGSGCPQGSASYNVNPEGTAFTMIFDAYSACRGDFPGADCRSIRNWRKFCQIDIQVMVPSGWQFSIGTIDYQGQVMLQSPDVWAEQTSEYYFQGGGFNAPSITTKFDHSYFKQKRGALMRDFKVRDKFALETVVWSPCGASRNLNIKSDITVKAKSFFSRSSAMITTDSIEGTFKATWNVKWRRCGSAATN